MAKERKKNTKQAAKLKKMGFADREEYLSHLYTQSNKKVNELRDALRIVARELGRAGGTARAQNLSKEALSKIGKIGAAKRWGSKSKKGGK